MQNLILDITNELILTKKSDYILSKLYFKINDLENINLTPTLKEKLDQINALISGLEAIIYKAN